MKKGLFILLVILILAGCKQDDTPPKLVVFISVDQLSEDMFYHYNNLFQGGYKWMIENGVWFTNMNHEHWYTSTGPGHFVLGSGQHPKKGRILGNDFYDRILEREVYCVEDTLGRIVGKEQKGYSYRQIPTTALGDWLKQKYKDSKVFSVSGKDRAAILLAGKNPDLAVWYDWQGDFVTSDYYTDVNPRWLAQFNDETDFAKYRDSLWVRELDSTIYEKYTRLDNFHGEYDTYKNKEYSPIFPIGFDLDLTNAQVFDRLGNGPWLDKETLQLAETILLEEDLGTDSSPDILFIGLSGTDVIGHNYGPFSQEALDNQLKLDKYLQNFINSVAKKISLQNVLFVLTSDHGAIPLPEYLIQYKGIAAGRINKDSLKVAYNLIDEEIAHRFSEDLIVRDGRSFYYNLKILNEQNIDKTVIDDIIRNNLTVLQGIGMILTKNEILKADSTDILMQRFKNFTDPILSPDLIIIPKEYWTTRYPLGTTHGTPYLYDSNVPFILVQKGRTASSIEEQKHATVDIAPTIAKILGIDPPPYVDGKSVF